MADLNPQEKRKADDDVEHGVLDKEVRYPFLSGYLYHLFNMDR